MSSLPSPISPAGQPPENFGAMLRWGKVELSAGYPWPLLPRQPDAVELSRAGVGPQKVSFHLGRTAWDCLTNQCKILGYHNVSARIAQLIVQEADMLALTGRVSLALEPALLAELRGDYKSTGKDGRCTVSLSPKVCCWLNDVVGAFKSIAAGRLDGEPRISPNAAVRVLIMGEEAKPSYLRLKEICRQLPPR
jgi:hypothetical protein